jgi:signal transduction histidine kinase
VRFPLPKTLRNRIVLSHALLALLAIAALTLYASFVIFNSNRRQAQMNLERLGVMAGEAIQAPLSQAVNGESSFNQVKDGLTGLFHEIRGVGYTLYMPDGIPVIDEGESLPSPAEPASAPEIWEALNSDAGLGSRVGRNSQGQEVFYLAVRIQNGSQTTGILRLDSSLERWDQEARRIVVLLIIVAAIIWLLASLAAWLLARGLTGSVLGLAEAAETLSQERLKAESLSPAAPQEVQRLGTDIQKLMAQLESQVGELRSFISTASHELRTPLTSIKLRVEALRQGTVDDTGLVDRYLAEVESEVDRLSLMVNDMLDLSRIESGLKPEDRQPVDLSALVEEVCDTFQARAERGGVDLDCHLEGGLPDLMGSEVHLRRMLYNLVDNAIKYTPPEGQIDISLGWGERKDTLRLEVRDTGHGIAPSDLPHIFERFYRVEATRPRYGPSTGSGLGLPISKSIVEAHGGRIGVTSQVGQGTTFWVDIPVTSGAPGEYSKRK